MPHESENLSFNGVEVPVEEFRRQCLSGDVRELPKTFMNAVAYDYLQRVVRNAQPYEKWPKEIKEKLNSMGIYQENGTGRPIFDGQLELVWKEKADLWSSRWQQVSRENQILFDDNCDLDYALQDLRGRWWCRLMTWRPRWPRSVSSFITERTEHV